MRNKLNLLTACILIAGFVFAQEGFDSVEDIMKELMDYTGASAPEAEKASPVAAEKKLPVKPDEIPSAVESTVTLPDPASVDNTAVVAVPDERVDESHELFEGDFTAASQGLADLIKIAPENSAAWRYLRTLLERDHRTAEIDGMNVVDAAWSTDLVLRSYDLVSGASERMKLGDTTRAVDVEMLFPQVKFPKGTSAIYQPETETIFVNNTPQNLAVLETMMETMGVLKGFGDSDQVEIEAKFVEVSEGTLEELGFQWNFADPTQVGIGGADLAVDDGAGGLFSDALRGNPVPFNRTIDLGDGTVSASGDWSSFRFADTFNTEPATMGVSYTGGDAFDVLISALDQSTGADVLSAPRVLTRSGEEATIQVGELHYFPEVYEGDASQATIVHVSYEDFSEKLLGVELTVNPKVTDERQIKLELNPRITELAGWQTYQLAPADSIYGYYQEFANARFTHDPVVASLPIFKRREIKTQVTIADGSTIGMGGLINEKIESFEDKVPVLGSLPLVGRLFRNEGERAVKRNLLMFVTAKIIEPNGRIDASRSFE